MFFNFLNLRRLCLFFFPLVICYYGYLLLCFMTSVNRTKNALYTYLLTAPANRTIRKGKLTTTYCAGVRLISRSRNPDVNTALHIKPLQIKCVLTILLSLQRVNQHGLHWGVFWISLLPNPSRCQKSSDRKRKIKFVLPKRTKSALNRPPVYSRAGTFLILLESAALLRKHRGESCFLSSNILSLAHLIWVTLKILRLLP